MNIYLQPFIIFHKYSILSRFVDPRPAPLAGPWPLSRLAAGPLDPWHPSPVSPVTPIRLPAPWSLAPAPRVPGGPAPCSLAHCPAPGPFVAWPFGLCPWTKIQRHGEEGYRNNWNTVDLVIRISYKRYPIAGTEFFKKQ